MRIPKYIIVYKLWKEGAGYKEIAIKLYGKCTDREYRRVVSLKYYAERLMSKNFLPNTQYRHVLLDEKTGELINPETGEVVSDRLPLASFKEEFVKETYPTFLSHLGPSSVFDKVMLKVMVSPPGGVEEKESRALLDAFALLDDLITYLNVSNEVIKQEAALIIRMNKTLIENHKKELVSAALLIALIIHSPGKIRRYKNILILHDLSLDRVLNFIGKMRLKPNHIYSLVKSLIASLY